MVYTGALQRDYERLNMMTLQEFLEKQFDEELMLSFDKKMQSCVLVLQFVVYMTCLFNI